MTDVLLVPDSRARQAQARRNRLLEQSMKNLAALQRRAMTEKTEDLDALLLAITRLATSISQIVRLHHQVWREEGPSDEMLERTLRILGLDGDGLPQEATE